MGISKRRILVSIFEWFLFLILGYIFAIAYERLVVRIFKKDQLIVNGNRLHHSLLGVFSIALSARFPYLLPFGVGIIAQHTFTDGFHFLTKE